MKEKDKNNIKKNICVGFTQIIWIIIGFGILFLIYKIFAELI